MGENKREFSKEALNIEEYADRIIISDYMVNKFFDRAFSQKKRNVSPHDAEICINSIFYYIMLFNSLKEDTAFLGGQPLNQWPILSEFKDYILPNSLRWKAGDKSFKDVLVRTSIKTDIPQDLKLEDSASITEYTNLLSEFRSYFKKDAASDYVMLDSLRTDKSVADIYENIVYEVQSKDSCHFNNGPFVPIVRMNNFGSFAPSLFNDWYLNASLNDVYDMYISNLFF